MSVNMYNISHIYVFLKIFEKLSGKLTPHHVCFVFFCEFAAKKKENGKVASALLANRMATLCDVVHNVHFGGK